MQIKDGNKPPENEQGVTLARAPPGVLGPITQQEPCAAAVTTYPGSKQPSQSLT